MGIVEIILIVAAICVVAWGLSPGSPLPQIAKVILVIVIVVVALVWILKLAGVHT